MDDVTTEGLIKLMLERATRTYTTPGERAAMRSALSDAAHITDHLTREWMGVKKRPTKVDHAVYDTLMKVGDLIWEMREQIEVPRL